ncbi:hypothetical protein VMCG_05226 [Cytospora schulzeri]|uniref:BZIP domain-containing protein n=1 Tax=Cytospora schulzeri TaxID=448051 RepID=A0A423WQW1_9PEZI|nr:hypothetical protein VMCG_05226 [Valsa malicola]
MAIISKTFLISLLALFASAPLSTHAEDSIVLGSDGGLSPFDIPKSTFLNLTSNPNATGAITFNGPSLSDGTDVEYTLRINVTAGVPLTDATEDGVDNANFTVASVLSLDGVESSANKTFCILMFSGLSANITAAVQNLTSQDGAGCAQILPEQCISDLQHALLPRFDSQCSGLAPVVPISCREQFPDYPLGYGFRTYFSENKSIFYEKGSSSLAKGDQTAWTMAAMNIFPVFLANLLTNKSRILGSSGDRSGFNTFDGTLPVNYFSPKQPVDLMNNMSSSRNAMASGDSGRGDNIIGQPQTRPMTRSATLSKFSSTSPAPIRPDVHASNQYQSVKIDLTDLDDSTETKTNIGMLTNSPYLARNNMGQSISGGMSGMMEQNFYDTMGAVPKFDSEAPDPNIMQFAQGMAMPSLYQTFDMNPVPKFESQAPEPVNAVTAMNPYQAQYFAQASAPAPLATPAPTRQYSRGATEAPRSEIDHLPPNRIAEAGPIPHPDREWRPYGTNHWYIFLASPEILKYLSTSEIKEIREHCYQLSKATDANGSPTNAVLSIPDSHYTTMDAQTVWKHCDAYIRRRGQLRNNNAARRSRQRKEAELKYWKQKALEYGCPDHEFVWDGREVTPPPSANAYASTTGPQTRARARQGRPSRGRGQRKAINAARDESVAAP